MNLAGDKSDGGVGRPSKEPQITTRSNPRVVANWTGDRTAGPNYAGGRRVSAAV